MIIIFTQTVCGGCEALKAYLGDKINNPKVKLMNINEHPNMIDKYNLQGAPTTILFDENFKEIKRTVGFSNQNKDDIDDIFQQLSL